MKPIINAITDIIKKFVIDFNLTDDQINKLGKVSEAVSPIAEAAARGFAKEMKEGYAKDN